MTRMSLVTPEKTLTDTQGKFCNASVVPFIQPVITANVSSKLRACAANSAHKRTTWASTDFADAISLEHEDDDLFFFGDRIFFRIIRLFLTSDTRIEINAQF